MNTIEDLIAHFSNLIFSVLIVLFFLLMFQAFYCGFGCRFSAQCITGTVFQCVLRAVIETLQLLARRILLMTDFLNFVL